MSSGAARQKGTEMKGVLMVWPRADPEQLKRFNPGTKFCTMNCGPSSADPRSNAERALLCGDCLNVEPLLRQDLV